MRRFDDLPCDVKFHLFSFLNTRDVVSITSVNHANRQLHENSVLWRQRTFIDFGMTIPPEHDANSFYIQLVKTRNQERRVICLDDILTSLQNGEPILGEQPEYNHSELKTDLEVIKRELILGSRLKCITLAENSVRRFAIKPDKVIDFNKLYTSYTEDLQKKMLVIINQLVNNKCVDTLKDTAQLMMCFARNNSWVSLREFFCLIPKETRTEIIMSDDGYRIYFQALYYGNSDIIETLLNLGMNANVKCPLFGYRLNPLNSAIIDLERCTGRMTQLIYEAWASGQFIYALDLHQYYLFRINGYKKIIATLLHHGADSDVPDTMLSDPINSPPVGSPRDHAIRISSEIETHGRDLLQTIQRTLQDNGWRWGVLLVTCAEKMTGTLSQMMLDADSVLQVIIDAPKLENQHSAASTNFRLCSM